jgi:hypothetical protein
MTCAGLYSAGRGFVGYWTYPFYKQGASLTMTCLMHFFRLVEEKEGRLPPVLFLQMDNAAKDNKTTVGEECGRCYLWLMLILVHCE